MRRFQPTRAAVSRLARPSSLMIFLALLIAGNIPAVQAQAATQAASQQPRLLPNSAILELSAVAHPSLHELAEAALYFSAVAADRQAKALTILEEALTTAKRLKYEQSDGYLRGEAVMHYIHTTLLHTYHEQTTSLDAALLEGRYNCVSSSILFLLLGRAAGLDVWGVTTIDHSFVSVRLADGRVIDAETTNPYGWDPGSRKDFQDSKGLTAGFRYVPPGNYQARQDVGDRALIALVAQNMATLEERRQRWPQAVSLMVDAYTWWPAPTLYNALADRVNNYIGNLVNRRLWSSAIDFFDQFSQVFQINEQLQTLRTAVQRGHLADKLQTEPLEAAEAAIQAAASQGWLLEPEQHDLIVYSYSRAAEQLSRVGKWQEAAELLKQGTLRWPTISNLVRAEQQAYNNWIYDIHNSFARLFNSRRYEEASTLLEEALRLAPENSILLENRQHLKAVGTRGN